MLPEAWYSHPGPSPFCLTFQSQTCLLVPYPKSRRCLLKRDCFPLQETAPGLLSSPGNHSNFNHFVQIKWNSHNIKWIFFFFQLRHITCRIFVPWPGIEPGPQQWKCQVLTIGARESYKMNPLKCTIQEKEMATHSSILAWKSPWTEEPGRLQSVGLHDWACVHEGGGRWVGSNKVVELKNK